MGTPGKFGHSGNFSSWRTPESVWASLPLVELCHAHARLHSPLLRHMGRCYAALQCHTLKSIIVCNDRLSRRLEEFNVIGATMRCQQN